MYTYGAFKADLDMIFRAASRVLLPNHEAYLSSQALTGEAREAWKQKYNHLWALGLFLNRNSFAPHYYAPMQAAISGDTAALSLDWSRKDHIDRDILTSLAKNIQLVLDMAKDAPEPPFPRAELELSIARVTLVEERLANVTGLRPHRAVVYPAPE